MTNERVRRSDDKKETESNGDEKETETETEQQSDGDKNGWQKKIEQKIRTEQRDKK